MTNHVSKLPYTARDLDATARVLRHWLRSAPSTIAASMRADIAAAEQEAAQLRRACPLRRA